MLNQRFVAVVLGSCSCLWPGSSLAAPFKDVGTLPAPVAAKELIYSPCFDTIVLKNSASTIALLNTKTGQSSLHSSVTNFTDMSPSPDGTTVFAADYGGENIGYSTPAKQSYVHRLDLVTGTWKTKTAYIAGNVQAVSPTSFILKSKDQWVSFELYDWGTDEAAATSFGRFYAGVYYGDFRYDHRTQRLIHGNSNLSSQEIQAFKILDNAFVAQEGSGTYGSAQGYGGTVALATDGTVFYYGTLAVTALDVSANLHVFPGLIYAATGDVAFGNNTYYDSHTGEVLGSLGFQTTAYALSPNGSEFWAYDSATNSLHHFVRTEGGAVVTCTPVTTNPDGGTDVPDGGTEAGPSGEGGAVATDAGSKSDDAAVVPTGDARVADGAADADAGSTTSTGAGGENGGGSSLQGAGGGSPSGGSANSNGSGGRREGTGGAPSSPGGGATADASTDSSGGSRGSDDGCNCELASRSGHDATGAGVLLFALLVLRRRPGSRRSA